MNIWNSLNYRLNRWAYNRLNAFNINQHTTPLSNYFIGNDKPKWIELSDPIHFEECVRFNPVAKAAINLLSVSASNGRKVAVDTKTGEEIPWTEKDEAIQKAYQLLVVRPNPLQSAREFSSQGVFYLKAFGNRYVYALMPSGFDNKLDLLNIEALYNLPSQFIQVKDTGKIYNQTSIEGIIQEYARTNVNPIERYAPHTILHFNEINISSQQSSVMGISKLEVLKQPLSNIQASFEVMNSLLTTGGAKGIISASNKDGTGTIIPLDEDDKKEVQDKFKNDYGLLNGQNPFLLTPVPLEYIRTSLSSRDIGVYEDFSNNSILVSNEFGVPPELVKTYIQGATYENQVQSVRRLYQDTTIPAVADEDQYWSYRLNTYQYGFEIKTKWDHIPALQDAFKEKATAINLKGRTAKDAYTDNVITLNQYLEMIELPTVNGGDLYKYEWDKKNVPIENTQNEN